VCIAIRLLAVCVLLFGTDLSAQATTPSAGRRADAGRAGSARKSRYTPAETRAVGQALVNRQIAKYGRGTNAARDRDVAAVVAALKDAAAIPELEITPTIVNNPEINASAVPGGFLVVNVGLLDAMVKLAQRDVPSNSAAQRRRAMAYTAAVLGHEIAHVTLGHTDEIMDRARRRGFRLDLRDTAASTRAQAALTAALGDTGFLAAQQHNRDVELAADAMGALYLLRAKWEIQDAMNLFRWFDAMERDAGTTAVRNLSWLRSHPRASAREAALEGLRAKLKLRQSEFDDALTLVANGFMLDTAIVMLDRVLADFPGMLAARHARAAALHRKWLMSMPVERLRARGSVPVYEARFVTDIRGDLGSTTLLKQARRAYGSVLSERPLPYALSNLAVLDAYAGFTASARQRADSAVAMMPDDPEVLNNFGVVLFLGARYREANGLFARAASHVVGDDEMVVQAIRYNLGISFAASGDSVRAREALRRYVELDSTSAWSRRARQFLASAGSSVAADGAYTRSISGASRDGAASGTSPTIAGVWLGDSKAAVITALGRPDEKEQQMGGALWHYSAKGLTLGISDETGIGLVRITSPAAGDLDGVRVGDSAQVARSRWGPAHRMNELAQYFRAGWMASTRERQGTIREITATIRQ